MYFITLNVYIIFNPISHEHLSLTYHIFGKILSSNVNNNNKNFFLHLSMFAKQNWAMLYPS